MPRSWLFVLGLLCEWTLSQMDEWDHCLRFKIKGRFMLFIYEFVCTGEKAENGAPEEGHLHAKHKTCSSELQSAV